MASVIANRSSDTSHGAPKETVDAGASRKIAQDFILQFYSVRDHYPTSLHRFYREDSVITTGCHHMERVFSGKTAIEEYYAKDVFSGCFGAVAAFNAQFLSPHNISIMISGEMSNDDTSRRFSETFTLVRTEVDRFYVKSHMFHFQDEAFNDMGVAAVASEQQQQPSSGVPTATDSFTGYNPHQMQSHADVTEAAIRSAPQHPAKVKSEPVPVSMVGNEMREPPRELMTHYGGSDARNFDERQQPVWHDSESSARQFGNRNGGGDEASARHSVSEGKKSWALVAGSNSPGGSGQQNEAPEAAQATPSRANYTAASYATPLLPDASATTDESHRLPYNSYGNNKAPPPARAEPPVQQHQPHAAANLPPRRSPVNGHARGGQQQASRSASTASKEQLFVGNLPPQCTENELREFFEQFGRVLSVRIPANRGSGTAFGFVGFESLEVGQQVMAKATQQRVLMRGNHRINIELRHGGGNASSGAAQGRERPSFASAGDRAQQH